MLAVFLGVITSLVIIVGIRVGKTEDKPWAYPLTLSFYPIFYFAFAIYAKDARALGLEFLYAIPFFLVCGIAALKNIKYSGVILGFGFLAHGVYDVIHDSLLSNAGVPSWWPEFCGVVDVIVGVYVLHMVKNYPHQTLVRS